MSNRRSLDSARARRLLSSGNKTPKFGLRRNAQKTLESTPSIDNATRNRIRSLLGVRNDSFAGSYRPSSTGRDPNRFDSRSTSKPGYGALLSSFLQETEKSHSSSKPTARAWGIRPSRSRNTSHRRNRKKTSTSHHKHLRSKSPITLDQKRKNKLNRTKPTKHSQHDSIKTNTDIIDITGTSGISQITRVPDSLLSVAGYEATQNKAIETTNATNIATTEAQQKTNSKRNKHKKEDKNKKSPLPKGNIVGMINTNPSEATSLDKLVGPSSTLNPLKPNINENTNKNEPLPKVGISAGFSRSEDDGIILAESSADPGVPLVYRTASARAKNPERLNLDNRGFSVCPILEGEQRLHNNIIQNVSNLRHLPNLIFLDLFNNNLKTISNLDSLHSLRVLMLGANSIRSITGLSSLSKLDVLDLHGNKIRKIENLCHLAALRVLNLEDNQILGLNSLAELNLCNNRIEFVYGLRFLPSLQRIFLSKNRINSFDDIRCIFKVKFLFELTLDQNPVTDFESRKTKKKQDIEKYNTNKNASKLLYRQSLVRYCPLLKHLDLQKVTDEERQAASLGDSRNENTNRIQIDEESTEREKLNSKKINVKFGDNIFNTNDGPSAQRAQAIKSVKKAWDSNKIERHKNRFKTKDSKGNISHFGVSQTNSHSFQNKSLGCKGFYEIVEDTKTSQRWLSIYGDALGSLDSSKLSSSIFGVCFKYIHFDDVIEKAMQKLQVFSQLQWISFSFNNIYSLSQLDMLQAKLQKYNLRKIIDLRISDNPILELNIFRAYTTFIMPELSSINTEMINEKERRLAMQLFQPVIASINKDRKRYEKLLRRRSSFGSIFGKNKSSSTNEKKTTRVTGGDTQNPANKSTQKGNKQKYLPVMTQNIVGPILKTAVETEKKIQILNQLWPVIISDIISESMKSMLQPTEEDMKKIRTRGRTNDAINYSVGVRAAALSRVENDDSSKTNEFK